MSSLFLLFLKGLVFGIMMAGVPGPIFFLIVQRTITDGSITGLLCAFGLITADGLYALIAAISLSFIIQFFTAHQVILSFIGGFFLIFLSIITFLKKPTIQTSTIDQSHVASAWLSIFLLTLANPATVISYCIIFVALGLSSDHATLGAIITLVTGVMTGSTIIMLTLIGFLHFFKEKFTQRVMRILNKITAILLLVFGIIALTRGLYTFIHTSAHSSFKAEEKY